MADRISMAEVLAALDMELPHNGKISCPFHSDSDPSCHIYEDHWHSYCCGKGGDAIAFVMGVTGVSYGRACQFLARYADMEVDELRQSVRARSSADTSTPDGEVLDFTDRFMNESTAIGSASHAQLEEAQTFCQHRWGLSIPDLMAFNVRLGQFALCVPHYGPRADSSARVVGVKIRSFSGAKTALKGSRFTSLLYQPWSWQRGVAAFIVEGEPDTWTAYKWLANTGYAVFGLPAGASTWRDGWLDQLTTMGVRFVIACTDGDEAGDKARTSIALGVQNRMPGVTLSNLYVPPEFKDVTEAVKGGWSLPRALGMANA